MSNSFFGFLRCFMPLAVVADHPDRLPVGYSAEQLVLYTWVSQGLLGVLALWGWTEFGDRIRTGDVVSDSLRPMHPVLSYLYADRGLRAAGRRGLLRRPVPGQRGRLLAARHPGRADGLDVGTSLLTGLAFPLHFLPDWLAMAVRVGAPFPSMLPTPLDVLVERGSSLALLGAVAGQVAWAVGLLALCGYVQHRATAKLVVQGG